MSIAAPEGMFGRLTVDSNREDIVEFGRDDRRPENQPLRKLANLISKYAADVWSETMQNGQNKIIPFLTYIKQLSKDSQSELVGISSVYGSRGLQLAKAIENFAESPHRSAIYGYLERRGSGYFGIPGEIFAALLYAKVGNNLSSQALDEARIDILRKDFGIQEAGDEQTTRWHMAKPSRMIAEYILRRQTSDSTPQIVNRVPYNREIHHHKDD